ncbi:MAG: helix-turn-helix transcriptional regulator [Clostridiales bacterium]|nr:helix-turn-helix transcriptional regulator [Clostridiales bacterium]
MITLEQIRNKLQEELKTSGLSQSEIARRINVSAHTVYSYFHGKKMPALDTFANLCKELDIDPAHILCLT